MKKLYDKIFSLKIMKKLMEYSFFKRLLTYEIISYLFFGVMTTAVNFVVFYLSDLVLGSKALTDFTIFGSSFSITLEDVSTIIAWVFAVLFAYVTNKLWVFESKSRELLVVVRELVSFFAARIMSFVLFESLGFMLLRNILNNTGIFSSDDISKWVAKIAAAVLVVIFNYVMSKLVVFRKNKKVSDEVDET